MRQICASDLHLGYEKSNYNKVCNLFNIAESSADELILCGDSFDLWRYPVDKIDKTTMIGFKEALAALKETSWEIPITIIPGNHDYNLKNVWKKLHENYNVEIRNSYYQGNIYYTHGWEFDVQQRFGSFLYSFLVTSFPYIYQQFFKKPSQMGVPKNDQAYDMSDKVHAEADKFAIKKNIKYVVMGHTHIPTIFSHVVDCGDFVDSCSYIEINDKRRPELKYI